MLLEKKLKVHTNNLGSPYVMLTREWTRAKGVKKGDVMTALFGSDIAIFITPNSPLLRSKGSLREFKKEIIRW